MIRILVVFAILLFFLPVKAEEVDYQQIYRDLEVPTLKYVHDIDPGEYYDNRNSAWSTYPLMRLTSTLYFKSIAIEPGYYILTPREHKGDWYMLFKEAGKIKYIVPIYDRDLVPMMYYDENLPEENLAPTQKTHLGLLKSLGKLFPSSKREPIPQTTLEVTDLDNNFVSIVVYFGYYRYYTIFRTIQL